MDSREREISSEGDRSAARARGKASAPAVAETPAMRSRRVAEGNRPGVCVRFGMTISLESAPLPAHLSTGPEYDQDNSLRESHDGLVAAAGEPSCSAGVTDTMVLSRIACAAGLIHR